MAEPPAGGGDLDDGEVGEGGVLVVALLGGPPENVEGEIGVGLGSEGLVDVGWGEAGFEVVEPCVELFLERGESSWVRGLGWRGWWRRWGLGRRRWWRRWGLGVLKVGGGGGGGNGAKREERDSEEGGRGEGAVQCH